MAAMVGVSVALEQAREIRQLKAEVERLMEHVWRLEAERAALLREVECWTALGRAITANGGRL